MKETKIIDYKSAMKYLETVSQYGSELGLETIKELLKRIDNPQDKLSYIHVAGTNGKGSTAAYISFILAQARYKVGRYSSPAVFSYWERIQITDAKSTKMISNDSIVKHLNIIKEAADSMLVEGLHHPTIFEIETALAFLEFLDQDCNIVVLEVGLGGRLDATNVISNVVCSVITSISMDHTQFLGDTLAKIAYEKAGIIKDGCPVVSYQQVDEVREVINQQASLKQTNVTYADFSKITNITHTVDGISMDYGVLNEIKTTLLGDYQVENAAVAIETALLLQKVGYPITTYHIYKGIQKTTWSGRLEVIHKDPIILIDGAHNEAAAGSLRKSIELYFHGRRIYYIVGVLADKDYESILSNSADLAYEIITITPDNPRALSSDELALVASKYCNKVTNAHNVEKAFQLVKENTTKEDVIIAFGSLSYLGEVVNVVNQCYNAIKKVD